MWCCLLYAIRDGSSFQFVDETLLVAIQMKAIHGVLAPVVQRLDNAIHRINHYPADNVVCFVNTYPLDSDLSGG